MKKIFLLLVLCFAVLGLTGCSYTSEDEFNDLLTKVKTLESDLTTAQSDLDDAESALATAQSDLDNAESDLQAAKDELASLTKWSDGRYTPGIYYGNAVSIEEETDIQVTSIVVVDRNGKIAGVHFDKTYKEDVVTDEVERYWMDPSIKYAIVEGGPFTLDINSSDISGNIIDRKGMHLDTDADGTINEGDKIVYQVSMDKIEVLIGSDIASSTIVYVNNGTQYPVSGTITNIDFSYIIEEKYHSHAIHSDRDSSWDTTWLDSAEVAANQIVTDQSFENITDELLVEAIDDALEDALLPVGYKLELNTTQGNYNPGVYFGAGDIENDVTKDDHYLIVVDEYGNIAGAVIDIWSDVQGIYDSFDGIKTIDEVDYEKYSFTYVKYDEQSDNSVVYSGRAFDLIDGEYILDLYENLKFVEQTDGSYKSYTRESVDTDWEEVTNYTVYAVQRYMDREIRRVPVTELFVDDTLGSDTVNQDRIELIEQFNDLLLEQQEITNDLVNLNDHNIIVSIFSEFKDLLETAK